MRYSLFMSAFPSPDPFCLRDMMIVDNNYMIIIVFNKEYKYSFGQLLERLYNMRNLAVILSNRRWSYLPLYVYNFVAKALNFCSP